MQIASPQKVESGRAAVHRCAPILVLMGLLLGLMGGTPASAQPTWAALELFTGHWKGPFVAYTHAGEQVDSLIAEHRYRWDGDVQVGTQIDRYPDARNYVRNDTLFCGVTHGDETIVYRGRQVGEAVVWYRRTEAGLVESFRERVVETSEGPEYRIDGFGVYPNDDGPASTLQFVGRYRPVHQEDSNGRE